MAVDKLRRALGFLVLATVPLAAQTAFAQAPTITLRTSLACGKLKLWDERTRQLVSFQQLKSRTNAKGAGCDYENGGMV